MVRRCRNCLSLRGERRATAGHIATAVPRRSRTGANGVQVLAPMAIRGCRGRVTGGGTERRAHRGVRQFRKRRREFGGVRAWLAFEAGSAPGEPPHLMLVRTSFTVIAR